MPPFEDSVYQDAYVIVFRKYHDHGEAKLVPFQQESADSDMVLLEHSFRFDSPPNAYAYEAIDHTAG